MRARHRGPRTPACPGLSGVLLLSPGLPCARIEPPVPPPLVCTPSGPRLRVPPRSSALCSAAPQPPARTPAPSPRSSPLGAVGWADPGGERPPGPQLELGVFGHWLGPAQWLGGSPSPGARCADCGAGCPGAAEGGAGWGLAAGCPGLSGSRPVSGLRIPMGSPAAAA